MNDISFELKIKSTVSKIPGAFPDLTLPACKLSKSENKYLYTPRKPEFKKKLPLGDYSWKYYQHPSARDVNNFL